ncbi:hypothetical protein MtrunA17_Chr2g0280021 [Medicago truncatula]|uniref:Uncharacterized protein n=1 Tax=Medicago truncatula TaxID=3880 RepID=A0A396J2Z6_MEDTR|nr:hypothetical protein MtrunA17_Chr2g0280021 [Medicago truncatula]
MVNSCISVKSTCPPSGTFQSKFQTKLATKYSKWSKAKLSPGQILLPAPNGIIFISLLPVMSKVSSFKNLSGLNSNGSSQTRGSNAISASKKFTVPFLGTK